MLELSLFNPRKLGQKVDSKNRQRFETDKRYLLEFHPDPILYRLYWWDDCNSLKLPDKHCHS